MKKLTLEHLFHIGCIGLVNRCRIRKVTFPLRGFLGQDVAFVSMLPFDFTGARKSESFFGAGFGLHFWHVTGFDFDD